MKKLAMLIGALLLTLTGCSLQGGKPSDPVEFGEAWLGAVADLESGGNCDRVTGWMSQETRQTWYSGDCHAIQRNIEADLGGEFSKELTFDCADVTRPSDADKDQIRLDCQGPLPAELSVVGPADDLRIYQVSPTQSSR